MKILLTVLLIVCTFFLSGCSEGPSVDETIYPFEVEMSQLICEEHMGWKYTEETLFYVPKVAYIVYCNDGSSFTLYGDLGNGHDGRYYDVSLDTANEELANKIKELSKYSKN